jgi:hypothetical protein
MSYGIQKQVFGEGQFKKQKNEIPMMHTSQTTMIKSWGFHVALEIKINLNT